jgi:hypothetical protein
MKAKEKHEYKVVYVMNISRNSWHASACREMLPSSYEEIKSGAL